VSSAASLRSTSSRQALALSLGVPACFLTIALLQPLKTKRTQTLGFAFMTVCFVFIASIYDTCRVDHPSVLYAVYCLLLFSMAGGPNVTTFILPAETFPKEIRSTYNGMCAACGKLGAVVGVFGFGPLSRMTSFPFVMSLCACVSALGMALSHLCIGAENRAEGGKGLHRMSDSLLASSPSCDLASATPVADLQRSIVTATDCEEAGGDDDEPVII
jgi:PHS family inorganic phosphate transporter-like MFS transporter